jgi:hypothetical protein
MAAKKTKFTAAEPVWIARPHPSGGKLDYKEVTWPLPKPPTHPTLPTFPPPTSSVPTTLPVTKPVQERPVTKVVTVLPQVSLPPSSGRGNAALNVDGYRMINLFVKSDPVLSTADRGISLDIAFAPTTVMTGTWTNLGCDGECLFNFDSLGTSAGYEAKYYRLTVSDRNVNDTVKAGGRDLSYIVRVPVLGPFLRVIASNRGNTPRNVEVIAYLVS